MSVTLGDKAVAACFIALLMVGSFTAYLFVFSETSADPRYETRGYGIEGTSDGSPCEGAGSIEFVEHSGGRLLYSLTVSAGGRAYALDLVFLEDGSMDAPCSYVGKERIDGSEVEVWDLDSDGTGYRFWIDDGCRIVRFGLESPGCCLIGNILRQGDEGCQD